MVQGEVGLEDDVFHPQQHLKIKIWEPAFHCQHILATRGQVGALVSRSWYVIWATGLRRQNHLLLVAEEKIQKAAESGSLTNCIENVVQQWR